MTSWVGLTVGVAAVALLVAAAIAARLALTRVSRWRRKDPEELERTRRMEVNRWGRITAGHIVDLIQPEPAARAAPLLVYQYEVAGVTYEASQEVTSLPGVASLTRSLVGQTASVKYDPKKPTNSIIACEEWSGVPNEN